MVRKCGKMSKDRKSIDELCYKVFEVPKGIVACSADVDRRKKTEYILIGFGQFPKLLADQQRLPYTTHLNQLTLFQ